MHNDKATMAARTNAAIAVLHFPKGFTTVFKRLDEHVKTTVINTREAVFMQGGKKRNTVFARTIETACDIMQGLQDHHK